MIKQPQYYIYGKHPVDAAIKNKYRKIFKIFVTKSNIDLLKKYAYFISSKDISSQVISNNDFNKILGAENVTHQGIALLAEPLMQPKLTELSLDKINVLVMLDEITDPQNIGSIIRTAAAFGVGAVITTKHGSPFENSAIVKTSAGSFEKIPYIHVTNLCQSIKLLKKHGFWAVSLDNEANDSVDSINKFDKKLFVFGSEGRGIRKINLMESDVVVKIKTTSMVESLNVSNTAAICLHSVFK